MIRIVICFIYTIPRSIFYIYRLVMDGLQITGVILHDCTIEQWEVSLALLPSLWIKENI